MTPLSSKLISNIISQPFFGAMSPTQRLNKDYKNPNMKKMMPLEVFEQILANQKDNEFALSNDELERCR